MLVLSRKKNESIVIKAGEEMISLVVVEIRGDKCRIGLEAEKHVVIHRQEVFDAIQRKKETAGQPDGASRNMSPSPKLGCTAPLAGLVRSELQQEPQGEGSE